VFLADPSLSVKRGGSPRSCKWASGGGGVAAGGKRYKVRVLRKY